MINPDFLRTFLTLAETGHFTETAKRLHMTQPGVSQHIKKVEEYFDIALLSRQGKSFRLTEAGKQLVGYGKRLFEEHRRLQDTLRKDDPHEGKLRFSSPGSLALVLFDTLLEMKKKHRGLTVEMLVAPNASVVDHLKNEVVDVGFMSVEPKDPAVQVELFSKVEILLALPKGKKITTLEGLKQLGYVNHPDGYAYLQPLLSKNFPGEFTGMADIPVGVQINQLNRILDAVAEGLCFSALPATACERYHRRKEIQIVRLPKRAEEVIYKVTRRNEKLPSRYALILESLKR